MILNDSLYKGIYIYLQNLNKTTPNTLYADNKRQYPTTTIILIAMKLLYDYSAIIES
jgi:hypothetical protein